jgi:hypothetical protein
MLDLNGKSDPYYKIIIDGYTQLKSEVIKKNLNPTWNDAALTVPKNGEDLIIEVWDHDTFTSDDFMGYIQMKLPSSVGTFSEWCVLQERNEPVKGSIHVHITTRTVEEVCKVYEFQF